MTHNITTWPWYVAGPLIGLFVPLLLVATNKLFGISSSFVHACAVLLPEKGRRVLNYDMQTHAWKLLFVLGIALGGFISSSFPGGNAVSVLPLDYYQPAGWLYLFGGGLLVGFGTRWANGCTSGHAITGLSLLNGGSLIATLTFFASGMLFTWLTHWFF